LFPLPVHAARPQLRLLSFPTRRSSDLPAAWSADHDPDTTSRSAGCHAVPDSVRVSIKGLLCTAAVLVAASVTLTGCALFSSEPVSATCANGVSLYFADDKSMRTAAQRLREDDRVGDVRTETQEQMLRRLVRSFPELADGMRDQTSSEAPAVAAVHVAAVDAPKGELASVLGDEFADALAVEPVTCVKGDERTAAILSLSQSVNCRNSVLVYFGTDAAMTAAASALRNDH